MTPTAASETETVSERLRVHRSRIRDVVTAHPSLFAPTMLLRPRHREYACRRNTDLVVEGFPRSGNTYLTAIIELYNPRVRLAHHLHASAQFYRASRIGVPAVLLVRPPEDAIASLLHRQDRRSGPAAPLRRYIAFHRSLLPIISNICIVPFDDLIRQPDRALQRIASFSRIPLAPYPGDADAELLVFQEIDRRDVLDNGGHLNERTVARPSPWREERTTALRQRVEGAEPALLKEASQIFSLLCEIARSQTGSTDR